MLRLLLSLITCIAISATAAMSQSARSDAFWVQLEAQPSLTVAQERIRIHAGRLDNVNGFSLGGGWYAIALGPFRRADAETVLRSYLSDGLIPGDSYISASDSYRAQFWPVGANLLNTPVTSPPPPAGTASAAPQAADETPRQARASESRLTRDERKDLQTWLKWAGHYDAAIDGAFGRGTRAAMAAWQRANGVEETGVLTTAQRQTLRSQYFAILDGMDLQRVTLPDAGIEMLIPLGVVSKSATEYPFVQYEATGDIPARVLLISQAGDQSTLFGLFDIMQTLEIVPLTGPRNRNDSSFLLTGQNDRIVSHTEVTLKDGTLKGFTLVWPAGDENRRTRILSQMQTSFTRIDGVLDPAAGGNPAQDIDLVSGLEVRKPNLSRSGFFIDRAGRVITTAQAVQGCARVTLEEDYEATVATLDEALGIAILEPRDALAPLGVATLRAGTPRLKSDIAVAGYSYEGQLGAPTLTFGQLADIRGLGGEQELARLTLAPQPGDAGGPVLDAGGAVFGMLLPRPASGTRQLPVGVNFAVNADAIRALLAQEGVTPDTTPPRPDMAPEDLARLASGMTVLVSCWD
ncbi:serine protease [Thiosulfatihalobacter marinus]|uniref:serine protease n=1 Tax=Thiosulfatihalobacter marinus TaxID=2792481 RepID=UPI0018D7006A|nr:serine protease [Thiosulfatihalobacter marinus]